MPLLHVHILEEPTPAVLGYLRNQLPADVRVTAGEIGTNAAHHVLVAGIPGADELDASAELHTLIIPWAGLPRATRTLLLERPHVAVHNIHHNAAPAAEHAIALLLAAAKFLVPADRALRDNDWTPRYEPDRSIMLSGATALVLGYGEIGRRVAQMCRGIGMRVLAVRRRPEQTPSECPDEIHPPDALEDLLPRADAVLICLPYTERTKGILGAEALRALPSHAVLVNMGRGRLIDERALYEALRDGAIRAAGLDVWYNYPKDESEYRATSPSTFPFHQLSNVVMSPHRGGGLSMEETELRRMAALSILLRAAYRGEPIPFPVDVESGY